MRNIKEIIRGNDSTSLRFTSKNTEGDITFKNGKFKFDPELQIDGTSIDPQFGDVEGGNYSEFEEDGTLVARGDATTWDDLTNSLIGRRLFSNIGTVDYNYDENAVVFQSGGDINDNADVVVFNLQKPHAAKTDSTLNLHIHWEQPDNTDREFTVRYRIQNNNQAKTTAWTDAVVSTNANNAFTYPGSGTFNQITSLVSIDWSTVNMSSTVQIKLTRSDAVSDGGVLVTFIDGHYEIDTLGSRAEFIK